MTSSPKIVGDDLSAPKSPSASTGQQPLVSLSGVYIADARSFYNVRCENCVRGATKSCGNDSEGLKTALFLRNREEIENVPKTVTGLVDNECVARWKMGSERC